MLQKICFYLGIICLCYFVFIFVFISHGSRFFYIWLLIGSGSLCLSHFLKQGYGTLLPTWLKTGLIGMFSAGLFVLLLASIASLSGFQNNSDAKLNYLIVLGAQVREDGPSPVLQYRLDTAISYLQEHPETKVIVTGGQGGNEPASEASVMRLYLMEKGISEKQILTEDQSTSTVENLSFSKQFLDAECDSVGIVTNNFHVYRSLRIANRLGYSQTIGISAPSSIGMLPNNLLRESLSIIKDVVLASS